MITMEKITMFEKALVKVLSVAGSLLLTIFAGIFGMIAISALVMSIIEASLFNMIGCIAAGFIAWMMWSVRKDVLV